MKKGSKHSSETLEKLRISHIGKKASHPFPRGHVPWNKGKKVQSNTGRTHFKKGQFANELHKNWQGEKVNYRCLHKWLVNNLGQPKMCSSCFTDGLTGHAIHWANIDHKYKRVLNNYIRLCAKCHKNYDKKFK